MTLDAVTRSTYRQVKGADRLEEVAKLSETKNGSPRYVPIIPAVLEQIQALPSQIDKTVCLFPSERSTGRPI